MQSLEEMRDIPEYEGLYAATTDGQIYSYRSKKYLKPWINNSGYLQVGLCKDGTRKIYLAHRLIAETYLPNPQNLPAVNHIDEDKSNNALQNLEYCDAKYNCNFGTRNEKLSKRVICVETEIIYSSIREAAKAVDIVPSNISNCLAGRRKTAGGYHWKYYEQKEEI